MNSDLAWTIVRPTGLTNSKQQQRVLESYENHPKPKMTISRLSVAKYMVNALKDKSLIHKAPVISGIKLHTRVMTILILSVLLSSCGYSQNKNSARLVGGPCEGCEAIFEYGDRELSSVDTLPDFNDEGIRIKVTGTIFQNDEVTPAKGVILYIYHTNQSGIYPTKGTETGWAKRHGYIRGWVKTGSDGKYAFYTLKPGVYSDKSSPAHIHPTILEPDGKYYWLGSYHFQGDTLLTEKEISPEFPKGGNSGLMTLKKEGGIYVGTRDIILGKNISDYE